MTDHLKKFSAFPFLLAIFCFFLPFINVSCEGIKVASFTGIQLVTGMTVEEPQPPGQAQRPQATLPKDRKFKGDALAVVALLCGALGAAATFIRGRASAAVPAILGAGGAVALLLLKSRLDSDALREGQGMLQVHYTNGFWLTFFLYALAAAMNVYVFTQRPRR